MTGTESTGTVAIAELAADADILVTSYALLRLDFDAYQAVRPPRLGGSGAGRGAVRQEPHSRSASVRTPSCP